MPDYSDTRLQFRRGTFAEWAAANPILASGEPGYDLTNKILKVGDGTTAYASLSGITGGGGSGGGATLFKDLLDTPANFTSASSHYVMVNSAASALEFNTLDIVDDTTPQLGGNLNLSSNDITGIGNIDITGEAEFSSRVTASQFIKYGGTSSQFLKADGSVDTNTYLTSASALSNIVEDTSPQLGGNLDSNGNNITMDSGDEIHFGSVGVIKDTGGNLTITEQGTGGLKLQSHGNAQISILSSEVVINDSSQARDFRVEGDADTNLLFGDASTDRVGIGTNAPQSKLDVSGIVTASSLVKSGGTSSQFLKADGSVDSNTYATTSAISNSSNWDTAYSWGDHSTAGYLTSITGITISNFNAAAIVTESEDIASNDNDTTLPTSAAVKDYIDTQLGGGGLYNLVEDTTPQLGGTLDTNSQDITGGIRSDTIGIDLDSAITGGTPLQVYDLADTQPFFAVRAGSAFISAIFGPSSGSANNRIHYYSSNTTTGNYWRQDASETTYSLTRVDGGVADDTVFSIVNSGATFNENLDVQGDLSCSETFINDGYSSRFNKGLVVNNDGTHIASAFQVKGGGSEDYLIQTNHSTNRVGIRTNAAAATLDVNGDVAVTGTLTVAGDVTLASTGVIANTPTFGAGLVSNKSVVVNDDSTNNSYLQVKGDTDNYLLYTDPANDRVGIGTATPASTLDVNGTLTAGSGVFTAVVKSSGTSSQFLKADGSVDSSTYLTAETNDLSAAVTWANVPDANITESSVTQHQAALSITESQISDLQSYLTSETFTSVVQDTTPQLGGDLDTNGNNITGNGSIDITGATNKIPFYYANQSAFPSASTYHGAIAHSHSDGAMYFAHGGAWNMLANTEGGVTFNDSGADVDFKVEGDTDTDLFFVDASTDRVGISTATPAQVFDVTTAESEVASFNYQNTNTPVASGDRQSIIVEEKNDSIITKHLENTSNGSSTLVLKNLIRYGADFISIDDAYTTGLSTTYYPKLKVNTDTGAVTFNNTYTFPTADGSASQVLQTDGAGNLSFGTVSTTNLDTTNFSAATIVTEAEGIGSNDNDTTLPTSAAVKDYADTKVASNTSAVSNSVAVNNIVMITQTNYDALSSYDANTIYFIIS